jgi:D-glycero-beta-D-manno-heptose 1-phosphate adenylyltransferase
MKHLEIITSKIYTRERLGQDIAIWRFHRKKIVFTNGCFDLLHPGHIDYLSKAADLGDVLIIGVNTDQSVRSIKGSGRPITGENSRALLLAALRFTDAIILFDEETPYNLISFVQPDVLVKGADYRKEEIVGYDIVEARGGVVQRIELLEGYSTTAIERRIKGE